jgi:hypothetical protein
MSSNDPRTMGRGVLVGGVPNIAACHERSLCVPLFSMALPRWWLWNRLRSSGIVSDFAGPLWGRFR